MFCTYSCWNFNILFNRSYWYINFRSMWL